MKIKVKIFTLYENVGLTTKYEAYAAPAGIRGFFSTKGAWGFSKEKCTAIDDSVKRLKERLEESNRKEVLFLDI